MKNLLKVEELVQCIVCVALLVGFRVEWWYYPLLLLGPDIGMLGYLINTQVGAFTYNLLHHKGIALLVVLLGFYVLPFTDNGDVNVSFCLGLVLYGHASMDRIFGYGLKFGDSFQHTHLGWIGMLKAASSKSASGH